MSTETDTPTPRFDFSFEGIDPDATEPDCHFCGIRIHWDEVAYPDPDGNSYCSEGCHILALACAR